MTALISHASFASAYRQLRPVEKLFVDAVVLDMEQTANRNHERISLALYRPIPAHIQSEDRGMLEKPLVRAAITERINEIAAANELTVERVVKEYMAIAFSSIGDYQHIDEFGEIIFDFTRCTPEQLSAVKSLKIEEPDMAMDRGGAAGKRKCTVVLHDKLAGLAELSKFMGLNQPDNPHWAASNRPPTDALPITATETSAADAYGEMIG